MGKAYIVANKEQELNVLKKFEQDELVWIRKLKPTEWLPSERSALVNFPYVLVDKGYVVWLSMTQLAGEKIVYDGRKEEKMDKKYLVTNEFMNKLIEWQDENDLDVIIDVAPEELLELPVIVQSWHIWPTDLPERNNRLIAIIQWLNGEDVFETQKTYKYYVARDSYPIAYLTMKKMYHSEFPRYDSVFSEKKIFDTREEAEKWVIPDYEVVEIDENEL